MENPLHHFEIHPIVHLSLMGFDISISKAVIAMWIGLSIVFGLFMLVVKSGVRLIPGKLQIVAEISLGFIKDMVEEFIGKKEAPKYFPFIATIFLINPKEISATICSFPGIRRTPLLTTSMNRPNTMDSPTHIAITALLMDISNPIKLKWKIG